MMPAPLRSRGPVMCMVVIGGLLVVAVMTHTGNRPTPPEAGQVQVVPGAGKRLAGTAAPSSSRVVQAIADVPDMTPLGINERKAILASRLRDERAADLERRIHAVVAGTFPGLDIASVRCADRLCELEAIISRAAFGDQQVAVERLKNKPFDAAYDRIGMKPNTPVTISADDDGNLRIVQYIQAMKAQ